MAIRFTAIARVTHEEDRVREARFWASRSIAERVIAGWELADNNLIRREDHEPEKRTGILLLRIDQARG